MKTINAKIVNFNNMEFDEDFVLDINSELFYPIADYLSKILDKVGLIISFNLIKVLDSQKLQIWILKKFYPNYIIEDHQNDRYGVPDFKLINKDDPKDYFWVEVKMNQDGLKFMQLDWIIENVKKGEIIKVLIIKTDSTTCDQIVDPWSGYIGNEKNIVELNKFFETYNQRKENWDLIKENERSGINKKDVINELDKKYL